MQRSSHTKFDICTCKPNLHEIFANYWHGPQGPDEENQIIKYLSASESEPTLYLDLNF